MARIKHIPGDKPAHFIKEWREYRGLTQERLADRLDITKGALSNIENGKSGYTEPMLKALAYALRCEPPDLIMRDPLKEDAIWSIWEKVPPSEREQVISIIKTFARKQAS
tara:strand:+ start:78 stop:407 length:330 start_codon:yes stop_codon:yes gene_type:complete